MGKTRRKRRKKVSNRACIHRKILDFMGITTAKVVLPVYRMTPTAAFLREAGIFPAKIILDNAIRKMALRIRRIDPQ